MDDEFMIKNEPNMMLPPQMAGPTLGRMFIEIGNLENLSYNNRDYLKSDEKEIYSNIKFWGE